MPRATFLRSNHADLKHSWSLLKLWNFPAISEGNNDIASHKICLSEVESVVSPRFLFFVCLSKFEPRNRGKKSKGDVRTFAVGKFPFNKCIPIVDMGVFYCKKQYRIVESGIQRHLYHHPTWFASNESHLHYLSRRHEFHRKTGLPKIWSASGMEISIDVKCWF